MQPEWKSAEDVGEMPSSTFELKLTRHACLPGRLAGAPVRLVSTYQLLPARIYYCDCVPKCNCSFIRMKLLVLLVLSWLVLQSTGTAENDTVLTIRLLTVLSNSSGPSTGPRQERRFEILPAAHMAVDEINKLSNLLPNYYLELVDIVTEGCNSELALVETVKHLSDEGKGIVGIIGLFCNEITQTISNFNLAKPFFSLLQLSGATSPIFRDTERYPYLYRMLPSSAVYTEAAIHLFEQFEWGKIGILYATIDNNFYFRTAKTIAQRQSTSSEKIKVTFYGEVTPREFPEFPILQSLRRSGTKITLLLLPVSGASELLCSAYTQGYRWPDYAWLLVEADAQDSFTSQGCDEEVMQKATEGVFLLHYHFQPEHQNSQLVSGITYNEYIQKLHKASDTNRSNPYAHVLYDSVWAFALALNNSDDAISGNAASKIQLIRNATINKLPNVSFTGALGKVNFDSDQEVKLSVDILQIKNGTSMLVGNYDPVQKHLIIDRICWPDTFR